MLFYLMNRLRLANTNINKCSYNELLREVCDDCSIRFSRLASSYFTFYN